MYRSPKYITSIVCFALIGFATLWFAFGPPAATPLQAANIFHLAAAPPVIASETVTTPTELRVTVGTDPDICPTTNTITVSMGTLVHYCYLLKNNSEFTLTSHSLLDDHNEKLLSNAELTITPSSGMTPAQEIPGTAEVLNPISTIFTWIATSTNGLTFSASSQIHIIVPALAFSATASTTPATCGAQDTIDVKAGTQVYYCYHIRNSGALALTIPQIDASAGVLLGAHPPFALAPGASMNLTATAHISETSEHVISLTGYTANHLTTTVQGKTTVHVPAISVRATVGLTQGTCADEDHILVRMGTVVVYCYAFTNTGGVQFSHHRITGPGLTPYAELTETVAGILPMAPVTETAVYPVRWVAWNDQNLTATASSLVTVTTMTTATVQLYYDVNHDNRRTPFEPVITDTHLLITHPASPSITETTDSAGIIVLKNLPARIYTIAATGAHFRRDFLPSTPRPLDLRKRETQTITLAYTVPLTVDDDGDGVPNWREGADDQDGDGIPNYLDYAQRVFIAVLRRPK